jgi:vancomycin resistance protein YoaR
MSSPASPPADPLPRRARTALGRWKVSAALLGVFAGVLVSGADRLPADGAVARGVRIGGVEIAPGEPAIAAAEAAAARALARRVAFTRDKDTVAEASLAELGGHVDTAAIAAAAGAVAHTGGIFARLDDALEARRGAVDLPVRVELPVEPLAARLERLKEERDTAPVAARLDLAHHTATAHAPGRYLDVYAAVEAVLGAMSRGEGAVSVPVFEIAPSASSEVVAAMDTSAVLSRFETRFGFVGNQVGRAQNIRRAADQMEGVVLMPGEVVSFNRHVGPRSIDNGFAEAPEIRKGELQEGIGGGTCQVSGTLHAAAFFGGVDIVERANHSRPSGYIRMGLDATVVYPTVDLKLRNPYDFPLVVHASIDKGTLAFELRGARRPATVSYDTATVGTADYKRKVEEVAGLPEGKAVLKQHGIRGISIKKTRIIHLADGRDRVEVSTDIYPPTFEIYQVAPGTDVEAVLPPLPDPRTATNEAVPAPAPAPPAGAN